MLCSGGCAGCTGGAKKAASTLPPTAPLPLPLPPPPPGKPSGLSMPTCRLCGSPHSASPLVTPAKTMFWAKTAGGGGSGSVGSVCGGACRGRGIWRCAGGMDMDMDDGGGGGGGGSMCNVWTREKLIMSTVMGWGWPWCCSKTCGKFHS